MNVIEFICDIERFGFEKVLEVPFESEYWKQHDTLYVYFHKKYGILLQFDTFGGKDVNGGNYYYQWRASKEWVLKDEKHKSAGYHPCLSSGGYIGDKYASRKIYDMFWHGSGDCRSSMIYCIKELARDGEFITPWIKTDGVMSPTFIHYGDHDCYDGKWDDGYQAYCDALKIQTPKRFDVLPEYVQNAIRNGMRMGKFDGE